MELDCRYYVARKDHHWASLSSHNTLSKWDTKETTSKESWTEECSAKAFEDLQIVVVTLTLSWRGVSQLQP